MPSPIHHLTDTLRLSVLFALVLGPLSLFGAQTPPEIRYIQAAQLKVFDRPLPDGRVLGKWLLNQEVRLVARLNENWCEASSADGTMRGFVDCALLGAELLTLERVEREANEAVLAINRKGFNPAQRYSGMPKEEEEAARFFDGLLTLLESSFALSPSLYTYVDFNHLLGVLNTSESEPLKRVRATHSDMLDWMRSTLSQDFASRAVQTVRHPLNAALNHLLQQRRYGDALRKSRPLGPGRERALTEGVTQPAQRASFFTGSRWAAGWAGGGLVGRVRESDPNGVAYTIRFDGTGPWALADAYEMAKAQRLAVQAAFGRWEPGEGESMDGSAVETLVLEMRLPVWAITAKGLVPGTLRRASFGGDACTNNSGTPTQVEVIFARPIAGEIQGIFASNTPIDATRARVSVRQGLSVEPIETTGGENTFTNHVETSLDLDGDGVADLRTLVSQDSAVSVTDPPGRFIHAIGAGGGALLPVGGWYAYDVFQLQVNESGWWRTISRYSLVTCT